MLTTSPPELERARLATEKVRIVVLWTELTGYLNECLRQLEQSYFVELTVIRQTKGVRRAYDDSMFRWIDRCITLDRAGGTPTSRWQIIESTLDDCKPHVAVIAGWSHFEYLRAAHRLHNQAILTICTADNPWRGTPRQHVGSSIARHLFPRLFDLMWVPGERAAVLARRLGFGSARTLQGLYSCHFELFNRIADRRFASPARHTQWPRRLLFAGRFVHHKGIRDLIDAYEIYRRIAPDPWELWCAGGGPLESLIRGREGIRALGFLQPAELAEVMGQVGLFVLPSHREAWGVVVHEAASAGLPIICTSACGSSTELVQHGVNGFIFRPGDIASMVALMIQCTSRDFPHDDFGRSSNQIAHRFTPQIWANTLAGGINNSRRFVVNPRYRTERQPSK